MEFTRLNLSIPSHMVTVVSVCFFCYRGYQCANESMVQASLFSNFLHKRLHPNGMALFSNFITSIPPLPLQAL